MTLYRYIETQSSIPVSKQKLPEVKIETKKQYNIQDT